MYNENDHISFRKGVFLNTISYVFKLLYYYMDASQTGALGMLTDMQ